ncbi:hypothetical protein [Rouxiella sp. WC2420]|uniref:Glycine-rich domain-containing protein n=1 Tax=Rouxiella sp. WC2420 TaxID=3234145 RepID=A0AB39VJX0_9GAMM
MQSNSLPTKISVPFANSGTKNTIPVASQIGITGGAASFTDGFPPLTMTPITAGGIPPAGADFNGILNAITVAVRWSAAGSGYPFDSDFSTAVTGYPKGALIPSSDFSGYWINTQDGNTTSPENATSAITGWVPGVQYGSTAITGISGSSLTLTTTQAAKQRITLAGALSANINLVFPAWVRSWTVVNGCTGNFSIICKTPSGTGVSIPAGMTAAINGDGTNITQDTNILGVTGRLINVQTFTASGTYTPSAGVKAIKVTVTGGGGGGAGCKSTSSAGAFSGAGGGSGATAIAYLLVTSTAGVAITVGAGGAGGAGVAAGSLGGTSSYGTTVNATGGGGGGRQSNSSAGGTGGTATGGTQNISGGYGGDGQNGTYLLNGIGAASFFGGGGRAGSSFGVAGLAYGSGGGGAYDIGFTNTSLSGGAGAAGIVIIEEYS